MENTNINFNSPIASFRVIKDEQKPTIPVKEIIHSTNVKLPKDAPARMKTLIAEGNKWYVTIVLNEDNLMPHALFCHSNKEEAFAETSDALLRLEALAFKKGIDSSHIEKTINKIKENDNISKIARMISLNLRHGVLPSSIVSVIDEMDDVYVGSFLFQIKKLLSQYIPDGEIISNAACLQCGSNNIVYESGCHKCLDCNYSGCS